MRKSAAFVMAAAIAFTPAVVERLTAHEQLDTQDVATAQGSKFVAAFDGGIGVDPLQNVLTNPDGTFQAVRRNLVKGVVPAPGPWRIADLKAVVDADGRIRVRGRGLLLAGGDNIGRNGNLSVFATLICEATAPFVERNSAETVDGGFEGVVPLEPDGDFFIDATLKTSGIIINDESTSPACPHPTLLIRAGSGAWLAAGIPVLPHNEQ